MSEEIKYKEFKYLPIEYRNKSEKEGRIGKL